MNPTNQPTALGLLLLFTGLLAPGCEGPAVDAVPTIRPDESGSNQLPTRRIQSSSLPSSTNPTASSIESAAFAVADKEADAAVVLGGRLFCSAYGELFCLDLNDRLKTIWSVADDLYYDHTNLIAGNDRVLIWNTDGELILIRADADEYEVVSQIRPFGNDDVESMSHPAVDGLAIRSTTTR